MNMNFQDSTAISRAEYNEPTQQLTVVFRSGLKYFYQSVPKSTVIKWFAAPSKGQFFVFYIRDKFRYSR